MLEAHMGRVNAWIGRHPLLFWLAVLAVLAILKVRVVVE